MIQGLKGIYLETELIFYKHGKTFACILNLCSWEILHVGEKIADRSQRADKQHGSLSLTMA